MATDDKPTIRAVIPVGSRWSGLPELIREICCLSQAADGYDARFTTLVHAYLRDRGCPDEHLDVWRDAVAALFWEANDHPSYSPEWMDRILEEEKV